MRSDMCLARTHLILGRIAELNSYHAAATLSIHLAHTLDPWSGDIRAEWMDTLPRKERIEELEKYLADASGDDNTSRKHAQMYLTELIKADAGSQKACQLVSTAQSASLPVNALMYDASNIRAFGLDVKLNDRKTRLEIDTGAGGLTVSSKFAEQAKLIRFAAGGLTGIGDQGDPNSYSAYAESIKIGDFEFRDCVVHVVSSKRMDSDGLVGLDVFSNFLITLNYPERKLTLGPLPLRPGGGNAKPTLGTGNFDNAEAAPGQPGGESAAQSEVAIGPIDRYIAPQMKDYTQVYRIGHQLLLPVSLNNAKSCLMILDTGSWATNISPTAASTVTKVYLDRDSEVKGLNGKVDKVYTAGEITFTFARKSQMIQNVPSFDTSRLSHLLGIETSGFLGARTLVLLTLHIDYRDGLIKLDYDPNKTKSDAYGPPE